MKTPASDKTPLLPADFISPPREFTLLPFWFWNDALTEAELVRQISDFQAHGVHGFVIHPRVGLPRDIPFMSPRMLHFVRFAVAEAARRDMLVVLYDEGMYPSGSASGLVVAANPDHRARCFIRRELAAGAAPDLSPDERLVAVVPRAAGGRIAVIDRPANSVIRGLHYVGEGPAEDLPPAANILNPASVESFIRIVYDGYYAAVGEHFGKTVIGLFTDEPSATGRGPVKGAAPGTTGFLNEVNRLLGYDFTPHLPALWYDDEPDAPAAAATTTTPSPLASRKPTTAPSATGAPPTASASWAIPPPPARSASSASSRSPDRTSSGAKSCPANPPLSKAKSPCRASAAPPPCSTSAAAATATSASAPTVTSSPGPK